MRRVSRSIVFFATLFVAAAAFATLGEDVSSIRSDQARMNAQVRVGVGQSYSVHELSSPAGTTITAKGTGCPPTAGITAFLFDEGAQRNLDLEAANPGADGAWTTALVDSLRMVQRTAARPLALMLWAMNSLPATSVTALLKRSSRVSIS